MENQQMMQDKLTRLQVISILSIYFLGYLFLFPVFIVILGSLLMKIDFSTNINASIWVSFISFFLTTLICMNICSKYLNSNLKTYISNLRLNIKKTLFYFLITFGANILLNIIITTFLTENSSSANQLLIIEMYQHKPLLMTILTVVFAPICEELVFRGAIFSSFRKKNIYLAYLLSSLSFGLVHVFDSIMTNNLADLIFIIVYAFIGFVLTYSYDKTDSIVTSILVHMLNNLVGVLGILISLFIL